MIITYKGCTEYLFNDYNVVKRNNEPEFIYNGFEASGKLTSKI